MCVFVGGAHGRKCICETTSLDCLCRQFRALRVCVCHWSRSLLSG